MVHDHVIQTKFNCIKKKNSSLIRLVLDAKLLNESKIAMKGSKKQYHKNPLFTVTKKQHAHIVPAWGIAITTRNSLLLSFQSLDV